MVIVPFSGSVSAMVRGKRSPCSLTRSHDQSAPVSPWRQSAAHPAPVYSFDQESTIPYAGSWLACVRHSLFQITKSELPRRTCPERAPLSCRVRNLRREVIHPIRQSARPAHPHWAQSGAEKPESIFRPTARGTTASPAIPPYAARVCAHAWPSGSA